MSLEEKCLEISITKCRNFNFMKSKAVERNKNACLILLMRSKFIIQLIHYRSMVSASVISLKFNSSILYFLSTEFFLLSWESEYSQGIGYLITSHLFLYLDRSNLWITTVAYQESFIQVIVVRVGCFLQTCISSLSPTCLFSDIFFISEAHSSN